MTPEQFAYWLHGYLQARGDVPSAEEWQRIREKLDAVMNKYPSQYPLNIDPGMTVGVPMPTHGTGGVTLTQQTQPQWMVLPPTPDEL